MKTRKLHRILEATFLMGMIIMIYVLSIFSAKGQAPLSATSDDLIISYLNEGSFIDERIIRLSEKEKASTMTRMAIKSDSVRNEINMMPVIKRKRRRFNKFLAPSIAFPIN